MGYTTYVFQNLEEASFGKKYVMTIRFPNWECRNIDIGDIGYMTYKEVIAGKDTWYDNITDTFIPYNYTNIIFIKFVLKQDNFKKENIIL